MENGKWKPLFANRANGSLLPVSRRLLNPYKEIGSRYLSMSMIVIDLSIPILLQRWRCLMYDVY